MLRARLREQDLDLVLTAAAMDKLGEAGFDPVYGVRPLKRTLHQSLENPLAQAILSGQFSRGDTVSVDWVDDKPVFSRTTEQAA